MATRWLLLILVLGATGCGLTAHSGWSVSTRARAREHAGMAGMSAHAALYGVQIITAVDEVSKAATGLPAASLAVQRATLAARTLSVLSGEPLPGNQRRLGEALAALDYALVDLRAMPDAPSALLARVDVVEALLAHLRLDLRAIWAVKNES